MTCPACGCSDLKPHGHYPKYHRDKRIDIVRILCADCGVTHALIPSFSLPDSSHDTEDVEKYLTARELGQTRRKAGAHLLAAGRDLRTLKRIERSFARCVRNWSAIFAMALDARTAFAALAAVVVANVSSVAETAPVFQAANRYALERGLNAVFASRSSILRFRSRKTGVPIPHDLASPRNAPKAPDSS